MSDAWSLGCKHVEVDCNGRSPAREGPLAWQNTWRASLRSMGRLLITRRVRERDNEAEQSIVLAPLCVSGGEGTQATESDGEEKIERSRSVT